MSISLNRAGIAICIGAPCKRALVVRERHPLWLNLHSLDVSCLDLEGCWPAYRGPADAAEIGRCRAERRVSSILYGHTVINVATSIK